MDKACRFYNCNNGHCKLNESRCTRCTPQSFHNIHNNRDAFNYCEYVALHTRASIIDIQTIYSFCIVNNVTKEWLVENLGTHLNQGRRFKDFVMCDVSMHSIIGT